MMIWHGTRGGAPGRRREYGHGAGPGGESPGSGPGSLRPGLPGRARGRAAARRPPSVTVIDVTAELLACQATVTEPRAKIQTTDRTVRRGGLPLLPKLSSPGLKCHRPRPVTVTGRPGLPKFRHLQGQHPFY
eukprot:761243-Hanusia_phi.AAC.1